MAKIQLNQPDSEKVNQTQYTLLHVLKETLLLLHPIIPFITESLWQEIAKVHPVEQSSISLAAYPKAQAEAQDFSKQDDIHWLISAVTAIRTMRSEMQISPAKTIPTILKSHEQQDQEFFSAYQHLVESLTKSTLTWHDDTDDTPPCANQIINKMTVFIPLAGLIQKSEEINRVKKQITKTNK